MGKEKIKKRKASKDIDLPSDTKEKQARTLDESKFVINSEPSHFDIKDESFDENISEKKKNKKKKKDKDENVVEQKDSVGVGAGIIEDSISQLSDNETEQRKKKKKKSKKSEKFEDELKSAPTGGNSEEMYSHTPSELGSVDTSILEQASVNLGLPLADDTTKNETQSENISKKKKEKKLKKKKSKTAEAAADVQEEPNGENSAINYLKLWHTDRNSWKFNKCYQVRLIHIMYDSTKMNDEDFEIFLSYLDGMQGKARDKTRDDAGKIVMDESEDQDQITMQRARQIFQLLS